MSDPGLAIVQAAERDPNVVAAILHGSRSAGHAASRSGRAGTLGDWETRLVALLRAPTVEAQRALFADVRDLMTTRGVTVHDGWQTGDLS